MGAMLFLRSLPGNAPEHNIEHVAECCMLLDLDPASLFGRAMHSRGTRSVCRWAVFYIARAWHLPAGQMSFPEMATTCGLESPNSWLDKRSLLAALCLGL